MSGSPRGSARHRQRHGLSSISMELMIVIVIVLILLLIAVPSYLGFMSRANSAAAQANLRAAIPAVEAYYLLTNGSYAGLDLFWLQSFDPGVKLNDPGAILPSRRRRRTVCRRPWAARPGTRPAPLHR